MVTDVYSSLLQELGKLLKAELQPDANHSCLLQFPNKLSVQIELDRSGNNLLIGCNLATVPPGRYRENVFREALKSNGLPPPRHGDFAYSKQADVLVLVQLLPLKDINGDKIMDALTPFLEKAKLWQEAITHGDVPTAIQATYSGKSGMFGLK
jgi:hypothetical protein